MKKRDVKSFLLQARPKGDKRIYRALTRRKANAREMKKRYGGDWKEVAARIAGRQGPPGSQHQGPPYTAPIHNVREEVEDMIDEVLYGYDPDEIAEDVLAPPRKPRGFSSKPIIPTSRG